MKKLYLLLLLSGLSIHAMDNLHIVPFEYAKHYTATCTILNQVLLSDLVLNDPKDIKTLLVRRYPATRSKRPDQVLGVIAYNTKKNSTITKTYIKDLAIAPEHQRKGYGRRLMKYVESIPSSNTHLLSFGSSEEARSFYEKLGYTYGNKHRARFFNVPSYCMSKMISRNQN
jgi:ribosomal protein S18 acetylase RimI-like enzyme